jgi:hypothetical protein
MSTTIPVFTIRSNFYDIFDSPVLEEDQFYDRLVTFIETNLGSSYKTKVLCYLEDEEGNLSEATLEEEGYFKSLQKCVKYYAEEEQYETCSRITKLIEKHGLTESL